MEQAEGPPESVAESAERSHRGGRGDKSPLRLAMEAGERFTVREAAERFGVPPSRIKTWLDALRKSGRLRTEKEPRALGQVGNTIKRYYLVATPLTPVRRSPRKAPQRPSAPVRAVPDFLPVIGRLDPSELPPLGSELMVSGMVIGKDGGVAISLRNGSAEWMLRVTEVSRG